jgi:hypothetical protein
MATPPRCKDVEMPKSFRSITILIALATFAVGITAHAIAKDETLEDWIDMWKQDRVQIENYARHTAA